MIPFVKTQALGNDFILVEQTSNIPPDYAGLAKANLSSIFRCRRRRSDSVDAGRRPLSSCESSIVTAVKPNVRATGCAAWLLT